MNCQQTGTVTSRFDTDFVKISGLAIVSWLFNRILDGLDDRLAHVKCKLARWQWLHLI